MSLARLVSWKHGDEILETRREWIGVYSRLFSEAKTEVPRIRGTEAM
jgi:hypothetical protein